MMGFNKNETKNLHIDLNENKTKLMISINTSKKELARIDTINRELALKLIDALEEYVNQMVDEPKLEKTYRVIGESEEE